MLDLLNWSQTIDGSKHVMDLGSGHGGGSHMLAKKFGCKVTVSGCLTYSNGFNNLTTQATSEHDALLKQHSPVSCGARR